MNLLSIFVDMKIYIIRHAKVDMKWPKLCTSMEFDRACEKYDESSIIDSTAQNKGLNIQKLYVSELSRSQETAKCLFPSHKFVIKGLLNEVPLKSSFDCYIKLPLLLWNITGRLQWFLNNTRQPEIQRCTIARAEKISELLLKNKEDAILVTHGFYMKTLISQFRKHSFKIKRNSLRYINLEIIEAERKISN